MARGAYIGINTVDLPSGYTKLDYIEGSGTQYIDTGIKPNNNTKLIMKASETYASVTDVSRFGLFFLPSKRIDAAFGGSGYLAGVATVSSYPVITTLENGTVTVDNTVYTFTTQSDFSINYSLPLFGHSASGTVTPQGGRIYYCQIYESGILVRDFVPCLHPDGTCGMFDIVNKQFYENAGTESFIAGNQESISVARKIKKGYVGVETEIPIYEEIETEVSITRDNITDVFIVLNGAYYFAPGSNNRFVTNNKGIADSVAETILVAKYDMTVSFVSYCSTQDYYDYLTIKAGGEVIEQRMSGYAKSNSYSCDLKRGQQIEFAYTKNSSTDSYSDFCRFSNMVVTYRVKEQISSEIKNVARNIVKAYIGIGGFARPCWSGSPSISYYGTITNLLNKKYNLASTTVGDYVIFGGGSGWTTYTSGGGQASYPTLLDIYDKSLTKYGSYVYLSVGRTELAATTVGDYALFGGGMYSSSSQVHHKSIDAYNKSLTRTTPTELSAVRMNFDATTVGNYALFGGGTTYSMDAYDKSLTKTTPSNLSQHVRYFAATTVGNYALFGGGCFNFPESFSTVDVYDVFLTKTVALDLSISRYRLAATTVGDYALFGGGTTNNSTENLATVDAYDSLLTKIMVSDLSVGRFGLAATTVGNYALFGGGCIELPDGVKWSVVDVYDKFLTKSNTNDLSDARSYLTATTIGNYALFGGGNVKSTPEHSNVVDVYTIA